MITADRLKSLLTYDPGTGIFVWKVKRGRSQVGDIAGTNVAGYNKIQVDNKYYHASRLAWLYMTGACPLLQIDHINRIPSDNRFCNLREVTPWENSRNKSMPVKGYRFKRDRRVWESAIMIDGKRKHLGYFTSEQDARKAYENAARRAGKQL